MPSHLTRLAALALAATATQACAGPVTSAIYPAPQEPIRLDNTPPGSQFLEVTTQDGFKLKGITSAGQPGRPLLLVFHGNASSADTALQWLAPLKEEGFGIVTASYRGYSGQPGRPSEAGLLADARAFLAATRREAAGRSVWVVGHSLGGGVALALSRTEKFDALVTIGTFTRLRDMAPRLARTLVPDEYRNAEAVRLLGEPFYLIHGARDGVVSADMGKALFAHAAGKGGGAFLMAEADHVPPASHLRAIFAAIEADLSGRPLTSLPPGVQALRFPASAR